MDSGVQSNYDAQFGKYTLIAKLATGGMGEIFLAKLTGMAGFEKLVVIKRLLPHLAEDQHFVTMLLDEARIAARLSHPNVCQVYDLGEVGGVFYIAMEFLEGVPCSQLLKVARRDECLLDVGFAANILQQTCAGLHHAHSLKDSRGNDIGLVHRDVSPSNLFATVSGTIKVLDFGVAKSQDARARTHTGALKGKYAYMSPEQVMAHDIDRRSDVFSLGIVLFELLTTRRLFWRDSEYKMFQAIAEEPIPDVREFRPDVPPAVAEIVGKALSRDAGARYATAEAMGEAIGAAMALSGGVASNSVIAAHVQKNFDKQIRERRELVVTAVSPHNQPTVADGRADMGEHSRELALLDAPEIVVEESPRNLESLLGDLAAEEKKNERGRGFAFWTGLAVLGVITAVAGSFLWGYINADDEKTGSARDVVAGGDLEVINPGTTNKPKVDLPVVSADDAGPTKGGTLPPDVGVTNTSGNDVVVNTLLKQQGKRIVRCLKDHPREVGDRAQLVLKMRVGTDGEVISADLIPGRVNRSTLGRCITRAVRRTKFAKRDTVDSIKIPLALNVD